MYTIKAVNVCADEVEMSETLGFSYLIRKEKGKRRKKERKEFAIQRWSEWNRK